MMVCVSGLMKIIARASQDDTPALVARLRGEIEALTHTHVAQSQVRIALRLRRGLVPSLWSGFVGRQDSAGRSRQTAEG